MASRQGGKIKPLKVSWFRRSCVEAEFKLFELQAPKKDKKELDEDDVAFQQKKKQEEADAKAAKEKGSFVVVDPYPRRHLTLASFVLITI